MVTSSMRPSEQRGSSIRSRTGGGRGEALFDDSLTRSLPTGVSAAWLSPPEASATARSSIVWWKGWPAVGGARPCQRMRKRYRRSFGGNEIATDVDRAQAQ